MSLEALLCLFDQLADRSTNIGRIRKLLIINLINRATSRKGFLDRAVEVKASLTSQTKTKVGKFTGTRNQGLALPEALLKIPTDAFVRLGDVAEIEKGLTAIQKSKPGPYPLVVTAEARSTNATFDFEGPAVIIPMVSSTGHGHASLKRIHYQEGKFAAGNILSVVKPKRPDILNTRFLYEYLTAFKEELLVSRMVGTANVSLTINGLRDIPVPLIQGEDVAKLDELMALCDRLEAQLKERDVKQTEIAKAALDKFTEEPTPENLQLLFHPSFIIEPEDLLNVVLSIAVTGKLTGHDGKTTEIKTYKLEDVVDFLGGYAFKSEWFSKGSGIRLVRNQNISHGKLNWSETEYLPASRETEFSKWSLRPGDLVISLNRPFISSGLKLAWVNPDDCPCLLVQRTMCLRTKPKLLEAGYLYIWLMAPHFRQGAHIVPSSGVPYIVPKKVASMIISLPDINAQSATIRKVAELTKLIDTYRSKLEASRTTGEKLLEAMVTELTAA